MPEQTNPRAVMRVESDSLYAQRNELTSRITSGLLHDFNNYLLGVSGFVALALDTLVTGHPARRHLETVETLASAASDIARQLLDLGRNGLREPERVDTGALVRSVCTGLQRLIPDNIALVCRPAAGPLLVVGQPPLLYQAIANLVLNAADAMPTGGQIIVRVSLARRTGGDEVVIAVVDEGTGIAPELQERIFEPFFTTKPPGRGTGIGLAAVAAIAQAHGGRVVVTSTPGAGSMFSLRLPLAGGDAQPRAYTEPAVEAAGSGRAARRPR